MLYVDWSCWKFIIPQLDFYISLEEKNKLVDLIFEMKCTLSVDSDYIFPKYTILKAINSLLYPYAINVPSYRMYLIK
jgi:hypothetical protein